MKPLEAVLASMQGTIAVKNERVTVLDEARLPGRIDGLIYEAVFSDAETKAIARWLIWETAQALGIRPASINDLYIARGRGEIDRSFTVPAMNLRMITFDSARAVFRAANRLNAGALIFEIARSEMTYTDQRPAEYVSSILAAAIKEGYRGPVFIQGDHFQVNAKKYAANPDAELKAIKDLMVEAVPAGFLNIDIDTSTLVDLSKPTIDEQQHVNYTLCAQLTKFCRSLQPQGVTISIGGEIGEVGGKNSTEEEMRAYMDGYLRSLGGIVGISKISIQTGTSHGGVVLPDGTMADVALDFEVLRHLSDVARKVYHMGGAVQHGASTLPETAFGKFPECGTVEVHLATGFQTMIFDHKALPAGLRNKAYEWLKINAADERKPKDTDEQFFYKSRKKSVGPFKQDFWNLPAAVKAAIGADLEERFVFLFKQLNIGDTGLIVERFIHPVELHQPMPTGGVRAVKAESVEGLAD